MPQKSAGVRSISLGGGHWSLGYSKKCLGRCTCECNIVFAPCPRLGPYRLMAKNRRGIVYASEIPRESNPTKEVFFSERIKTFVGALPYPGKPEGVSRTTRDIPSSKRTIGMRRRPAPVYMSEAS